MESVEDGTYMVDLNTNVITFMDRKIEPGAGGMKRVTFRITFA